MSSVRVTLESLTLPQLKQLAKEFNIPITNNRRQLIQRLLIGNNKLQSAGGKKTKTPLTVPDETIPTLVKKLSLKDAINLASTNKWWHDRIDLIAKGLRLNPEDSSKAYEIIYTRQKPWSDALKHVHSMHLKNPLVTDVLFLKNVHHLRLTNLPLVEDISPLGDGTINTLEIWKLPITDVSALNSIPNLTLGNLPNLTNVSDLVGDDSKVRSLRLEKLPNLTDVSQLGTGQLQTLRLWKIPNVDLSALESIPNLIVDGERIETN